MGVSVVHDQDHETLPVAVGTGQFVHVVLNVPLHLGGVVPTADLDLCNHRWGGTEKIELGAG